jgi:hypothetical protein
MRRTGLLPSQKHDLTLCAYCGADASRGFNQDHVVPKSLRKRLRQQGIELPEELCGTVWACVPCNIRKGTRKLVPPSWENKIPALKDLIPGQWRVWRGDPSEPAYREAWV